MGSSAYSSAEDNHVRCSSTATLLCTVGGYWGLHELYLGRFGAFLAHQAALAAALAVSDEIRSYIPLSMYMALIAIEALILIRGHVLLGKKTKLSAPSNAAWYISNAAAIIALAGALCVAVASSIMSLG